jgi:hypothetical protein
MAKAAKEKRIFKRKKWRRWLVYDIILIHE